jgi:hypothetical protein
MSDQQSVADTSAEDSDQDDNVIFDGRDWDQEKEQLDKSGSNWFNPDPGTQKLRFLDDGEDQVREYDDEKKDVVVFTIKIGGEEKKWSVNKGTTDSSLWGQLVTVAQDRGGLEGEEITLIRSGTGSDTQYTVQEAADLQ